MSKMAWMVEIDADRRVELSLLDVGMCAVFTRPVLPVDTHDPIKGRIIDDGKLHTLITFSTEAGEALLGLLVTALTHKASIEEPIPPETRKPRQAEA